tara:strand:+ start:347 stop:1132 length:786 start_codon:yes stop_codon:yes gene_type:complete
MKKWFTLGAIFLTSYLVFMVATVPLPWLVNQVTLPKGLVLSGVSGTVWQGEIAQASFASNTPNNTLISNQIQQIKTELSFWSLFTLMPKVDVVFGNELLAGPEGKLSLAMSAEQISIVDADLFLNANDVAQQVNLPLPVTAKGEVALHLSQLDFSVSERKCQQAEGKINWSRAGIVAMKENIKLGKLSAEIDCEKGELIVNVTPKNDLGLSFSAHINTTKAKPKLSGKGYLTPGEKFPLQLKSVLPFLGNPDNKGRYRLGF